GAIIDVAMSAIAATYAELPGAGVEAVELRIPTVPSEQAHELGADNARVRELIESRLVAC
ncbi:MAG TPA: CoA transferase, partial [Mycobacterium sp.]|nr:CoA transferase [Mycobacterium sp.]